jgi:hypothetical protein
MNEHVWRVCGLIQQGKAKVLGQKPVPVTILSTTNVKCTGLEQTADHLLDRPATNNPSNDTTRSLSCALCKQKKSKLQL